MGDLMIKRFNRCIFWVLGAWFLAGSSFGEYRIWTNTEGKAVEAEYKSLFGKDQVLLQPRKGRAVKVPLKSLCEVDQRYVYLKNPPRVELEMEYVKGTDRMIKKERGGNVTHLRRSFHIDASLKKTDRGEYPLPLEARAYIVSVKTGPPPKRRLGTFIMEIQTERIDLSRLDSKNEKQWSFDTISFPFQSGGSDSVNSHYIDCLFVVMDESGSVLASTSRDKRTRKHLDEIIAAKKGDQISMEIGAF